MTKIDFNTIFNAAKNEADVNNTMTILVESVLKAGHARLNVINGNGDSKNTTKVAKTSNTKEKSSDERIKERIKLIKSAKPGTTISVTARDFRTKKNVKININVPTKAELNKLKLKAIDYSEKSFVVMGGTKEISKYLKHILGGTFNSYLECGAGWIFAKNEQGEAVKKALAI